MSIGNKSINQGKYQLILSYTFLGHPVYIAAHIIKFEFCMKYHFLRYFCTGCHENQGAIIPARWLNLSINLM